MTFEDRYWTNTKRPAEPEEYEITSTLGPIMGRPAEINKDLLEPMRTHKKLIVDAFEGTSTRVVVDFFIRRLHTYTEGGDVSWPIKIETTDSWPVTIETTEARLIDGEE